MFSALDIKNPDWFNQEQLKFNNNQARIVATGPLKKDLKKLGIKVSAKSVLVADTTSNKILFEKNGELVLPLASLTKLMTALVFLDTKPDWNKSVSMQASDQRNGGSSTLKKSETVKVKDLFNTALIASDNNATVALVRSTGISEIEFVRMMNEKAKELNLISSSFKEVTGLSKDNKGTVFDVYLLAKEAFNQSVISETLSMSEYSFTSLSGQKHHVKNTNKLLNSYLKPDAGKTGYTEEAGYCLALRAKNSNQNQVIAIILNSESRDQSFQEAKALIQWSFDNYFWQ